MHLCRTCLCSVAVTSSPLSLRVYDFVEHPKIKPTLLQGLNDSEYGAKLKSHQTGRWSRGSNSGPTD